MGWLRIARIAGVFLMAAVLSGPLTVLGVPDQRLTVSSLVDGPSGGLSTTTERDLEWDVTAASGNYRTTSGLAGAEPSLTGEPASATTYTFSTAIPGIQSRTARYVYQDSGSTTYGANEPYVFTLFGTVEAVTSGDGFQTPSVAATQDGRVHVAYADYVNDRIRYAYIDPSTSLATGKTTVWTSAVAGFGSSGFAPNPVIWTVSSNATATYSIYIAAWDARVAGTQVLRIARSDDGGSTWSTYYSNLSNTYSAVITWDQARIVWDPMGNQYTYVTIRTAGTAALRTYISNDVSAAAWSEITNARISNVSDVALAYYQCGKDGRVYMVTQVSTDTQVRSYQRVASFSGWQQTNADIGFVANGGLTLTANDSGWLYATSRSNADADKLQMLTSTDGAFNWGSPLNEYPYNDGTPLTIIDDDSDGTSTTVTNGILPTATAWVEETLFMVGTVASSATTIDNSVVYATLGGIYNVTTSSNSSGEEAPWYPTSVPETKSPQYQTFVTSGSTTQTIAIDSQGTLKLVLSNDNSTGYNEYQFLGSPTAVGARFSIGPDSAGGDASTPTQDISVSVTVDDGVDYYEIAIVIDATNALFRGYDVVDTSTIGNPTAYDNTVDYEFLIALDGDAQKVSIYHKKVSAHQWSILATTDAIGTTGTVTPSVTWGKITASTANVDFGYMIPLGAASETWLENLADFTNFPVALQPIRATSTPQRLPQGVRVKWAGTGPLYGGDSWTAATLSRRPVSLTSPLCASPSPTSKWVGATGSAGATYRQVYEIPGRLSRNAIYVAGANAAPIHSVQLNRWDGATYQTEVSRVLAQRPFGADGSVAFSRHSSLSYHFYPNGANGNPRVFTFEQLSRYWIYVSDGTNTIIGPPLRVDPGQFSTTTDTLQMGFELDPARTIVAAGTLSGLSTSTTTGRIRLYPTDWMLVATESTDTDQYRAITFTLADGITVPEAGHLSFGAAYILGRTVRDGSSVRRIAPEEVRELPGNIYARGRRSSRRAARVYDLPYDVVLTQPGRYSGGVVSKSFAIDSAVRGLTDNNLDIVEHIHEYVGQRSPVWVATAADFGGTDPADGVLVITGEDAMLARLEREIDITQSRGLPRTDGLFHTRGGRILAQELI